MFKQYFAAIAVLIGVMVGAGFLGIPYLASKSGYPLAAVHIIILGVIMLYINLYLGEMCLRTKKNYQLTGYAEKYLGKIGKTLMFLSLIIGIFSALFAYTIGISESINQILFDSNHVFLIGILFIACMSLLTYFGMQTFKEGEMIGLILMTLLFIGIIFFFVPKISIDNLTYTNNKFFFAPFGVILFAFLAFSAMPEIERVIKDKKIMKNAVIIGSIIPIVGYLIFTGTIIGFKGANVPEVATISLGPVFAILGIISMGTSFFALAVVMKAAFHYDYNLSKRKSWAIITILNLVIFIVLSKINLDSFTTVLNYSGIISGSLSGVLVLLMIRQAKKFGDRKPEYSIKLNDLAILLMCLVLIAGGIVSLVQA